MEEIPKENEKISAVRAARLSEKIRQARLGLLVKKAWWSDGPLENIILLLILALNFYLILPLIGTYAPEVSFSGPVAPFLANIVVFLTKTSFYYSLQIVYIVFFLIFPVTLYFFVKKLTERKLVAFFSCIAASFPIYLVGKTRILNMFFAQDGPHIMSLAITPVALYFLLDYLKNGQIKNLIFASFSAALVALTSPFGFLTYLIFAAILTFSEVLLGSGRTRIMKFVQVLFFAGALSSFWYNPAFFIWMITGPMGENIRITLSKLFPISLFSLPILGIFGYLLFDRKPHLQPLFVASFCTIAFFIITVAGGNLMPSSPARYRTEFGISISFLIGFVLVSLIDSLKFRVIKIKLIGKVGDFLANIVSPFTTAIFLVPAVIIRDAMIYDKNVLGIWTAVQKGDIWIARSNFVGIHAYIGYIITFLGIVLLTFFAIKSKDSFIKNKVLYD